MINYVCIDIGGTNTRVQLWSKNKTVLEKNVFKTSQNNHRKVFGKIANFIALWQKKYNIQAIGMSVPGPANYEKGIFFKLPNMPSWKNFNFKKYLQNKTKITEIKADNDANLMALAHHLELRVNNSDITQFFTVSTGLGAGLIINNQIFTGAQHYAQEIAFAPVSWNPETSSRFGKGALEHFCAGSGILERATPKYKTTKSVFANYKTDLFAKRIIDEAITTLANMIATTLSLINPSILVFDGTVAQKNKWYIEAAIKEAKKNTMESHFQNLKIYFGNKGDDAAIEGAFYLVNNQIK